MKQLGLVITQYTSDNDETMPYNLMTGFGTWRYAIYPCVKSVAVFDCQSNNVQDTNVAASIDDRTYGMAEP